MTREEAIKILRGTYDYSNDAGYNECPNAFKYAYENIRFNESLDMAIKALEQEPCGDEIILTKEEYRKLLSSEFDNGYAKGYREALEQEEQESILDKIRTEIEQNAYPIVHGVNNHELGMTLYGILQIIDKYKAESENKD